MNDASNNGIGILTNTYLSSSNNNANGNNRGRKSKTCGKLWQNCGKRCVKVCVKVCGKLSETQQRADHADQIADWLSNELDAPYCRAYFCKCAYYLPYEQITSTLAMAKMPKVKSPVKYFNAVTKRLLLNRKAA